MNISRDLHGDALAAFRLIQRIMGDRDASEPSPIGSPWTSTTLQEARALLQIGIQHPEMRDELYCQLLKQLTSNPSL